MQSTQSLECSSNWYVFFFGPDPARYCYLIRGCVFFREDRVLGLGADAGGGCRVQALQPKRKKEKMNMGVGESFKFLAKSPYIRDLALLVRSPISARTTAFTKKTWLQQLCSSAA